MQRQPGQLVIDLRVVAAVSAVEGLAGAEAAVVAAELRFVEGADNDWSGFDSDGIALVIDSVVA